MNLGTPQIIYLVMLVLGLGINLGKHGEPKDGKYNFFVDLLGSGIMIWILSSGGFFS